MSSPRPHVAPTENVRNLEALLRGLTIVCSLIFLLLFFLIALRRLHYPFEVDRMEDGMLTSVWRLRHGYPLYTAPSLEWTPFLYAPLFFYAAACATKLFGVGYTALRFVSIAATAGSFSLLGALVYLETRRWRPALFAAGLFAALYPFVQAWYDVGRVDSLALFFFLAALMATRRGVPLLAAVLWLLAFLTKQTFLPLGFAAFLVDWQRPRRMLAGMLAYGVLVACAVTLLQRATHGWFVYYTFGTAGVLHWSWHTAAMFPFTDLLGPLPVACGLIALGFSRTWVAWREGSYFLVVTAVLTAATWYVRAHVGANFNADIPLYAWMAVLAGIALDRLAEHAPEPQQGVVISPRAVWLLALLQLLSHLYRPAEVRTGNLAAREAFLAALRATPGDVWVVDHPYDGLLAGKPLHADMDALDAVLGRKYPPALAQFRTLTSSGALAAVVLDRTPDAYQPEGLFTTPPFTDRFRVRALAPGGSAAGELDQPSITLLPCTETQTSNSLAGPGNGMADRSACERP